MGNPSASLVWCLPLRTMNNEPPIKEYTIYCPFGGGGGGALGAIQCIEELFGKRAKFRLLGGFDIDPYAAQSFEYLTGVKEMVANAWDLTPADLLRDTGGITPDFIINSAPCVAASPLVSPALAATPAYVRINSLIGHMTRLILRTWAHDPVPAIMYENVPNIYNRARDVVAQVLRDLDGANYATVKGTHQCRTTGDIAQNRLRAFILARNRDKIPFFVYRPPVKAGKVCGDVLTPLPLPGDPAGGPMHVLPNIAVVNWLRLALIPTRGTIRPDGKPAKGDWRDLRVMLDAMAGDPNVVHSLDMDRAKKPQNNVFKVYDFDQPTGAVTSAQSPCNGAAGVAESRAFSHVNRVYGLDEAVGCITHSPAPSSGAPSIAAPLDGFGASPSRSKRKIKAENAERDAQTSMFAQLDMKVGASAYANNYAVTAMHEPARCVTGGPRPGSGGQSVASPLLPQAANAKMHDGKYVLIAWDGAARTVTGADRVGSGAQSVQDIRIESFREGWGILAPTESSGTVTANARHSTGRFSLASSIVVSSANDACYGVLSLKEPSHAITGKNHPGNGPFSLAEERDGATTIALGCAPHRGTYGVVSLQQAIGCVTAHANIDNGCFAVADKRTPGAPPLLWIEGLDKPARLWAGFDKKGRVKHGKPAPLIIMAEDGTWHRPLTTLELAVLQGLPWQHHGRPLDFGGGSTKQRKLIGNMIPPPVASAMASQILLALLAADAGAYYMDSGGAGVWVERKEYARRMRRAGISIVDDRKPWIIGGATICDDGAVVRHKKRTKRVRVHVLRMGCTMPVMHAEMQ